MKVLLINETCGTGSHGRICKEIADKYAADGHEVKIAYGRYGEVPEECRKYAVRIGSMIDVYVHVLYTRLADRHGFGSRLATKRFLKWVDKYGPDLVWLHNIHGYYINVELLFQWIKKHQNKEIKWTLHDCWAFTGHCGHYMAVGCTKWKTQCFRCPEKRQYPKCILIGHSRKNYKKKKELFCNVGNMSLIVPSEWLRSQVKRSFLRKYPIQVIRNQIDTKIFKRTESNIRETYGLTGKFIILGVASRWTRRKGFDDMITLSKMIDHKCIIVMVGLSAKQIRKIPGNIIGIRRTENKVELAELYSAADVFINLTYEENYPTVNLEAEACGTPVITYDTGGCRETVSHCYSRLVRTGDVTKVAELIKESRLY